MGGRGEIVEESGAKTEIKSAEGTLIAFYMADFLVDEATVTGAIVFMYSHNDEIKFPPK